MSEPKKFFHVRFTAPSSIGDAPVDGGGPFATFKEVQDAAIKHTPGATCSEPFGPHQPAGRIFDDAGCVIGNWEKKIA